MSEYPLPSYAASIWATGDQINLAFGPLPGSDKGSTVQLPCNHRGLTMALAILRERSRAEDLRIGFKGTPTKANLLDIVANKVKYDAWLASMAQGRTLNEGERRAAKELLEELGL